LAAGHVVVGYRRGEGQVDGDLGKGSRAGSSPLLVDGLLQELGVELEPDRGDVSVLLGAKDLIVRLRPKYIVIETLANGSEICQFLRELGYTLNAFDGHRLVSFEVIPLNVFATL